MYSKYGTTFNASGNIKFKNIKKIKLHHRWHNNYIYKDAYWRMFAVITQPESYTKTGSIMTSGTTIGVAVQYLNTQLYEERSGFESFLTLSGSVDNGVNWTKLNKNDDTDFGTPGNDVVIQYIMRPSGTVTWTTSGTSWDTDTPTLSRMILTGWNTATGGLPKSGTKVVYSDENSFSYGDVVYPPSWSAWDRYNSYRSSTC